MVPGPCQGEPGPYFDYSPSPKIAPVLVSDGSTGEFQQNLVDMYIALKVKSSSWFLQKELSIIGENGLS